MILSSKDTERFLFFKNLFSELFSINKIYEEKQTLNKSYIIPILEEGLSKSIYLSALLVRSQPIEVLEREFQKYLDTMDFNIQYGYRLNEVLKSYYNGYVNLLLFESERFHFTVHIKFNKNLTDTYNLRVIFTFWYENLKKRNDFDLNYLHGIYDDFILGHKISNSLESIGYSKIQLIDIDNYNPQTYVSQKPKNFWVEERPFMCITMMIELLNANPIKLINDLVEHVSSVEKIIINNREKTYGTSIQFFKEFSIELQNFIAKGNELFRIAVDSSETVSERGIQAQKKEDLLEEESKTRTLTPQIIIELFQKAYEQDLKKNESREDRGFRSLSTLYEEYGKSYHFSRATLYNCFNNSKLELLLEKRERKKQGGGFEFRIKDRELYEEINEENLEDQFMKEKMEIEKALYHYNKEEPDLTIKILKKVLRSSSKQLQKDHNLFLGAKFYLSKCYYQKETYQQSYELCEQILREDDSLIDVKHLKVKSLFKLRKFDEINNLLKSYINEIEKIFKIYDFYYEKHKKLIIGKFTPSYEYAKEFFKKLNEADDLTKFVLLINKAEFDNRIHFTGRRKKLTFYNNNTIIFEKLFRFLAEYLIINIELHRRKFFSLILENDLEKIRKSLSEFIYMLKSERYDNLFEDDYFLHYLYYFRNILNIYIGESELLLFDKELKDKFPNFNFRRLPIGRFPNDLAEISKFINKVGSYYRFERLHYFDFPDLDFDFQISFRDPELIIELRHIEANKKEGIKAIEHLIQHVNTELENEELINSNDIELLNTRWWEYSFSSLYVAPTKFLKLIEVAKNLCKQYNISDFINQFSNIYKNLEQKVKNLNQFRAKGKRLILNRLFELLSLKFSLVKEGELTLNFNTIPKGVKKEDFFYDTVIPEIKTTIRNYQEKRFKLTINLPGKYFTQNIPKHFKTFFWKSSDGLYNSLTFENVSDKKLLIKPECICGIYGDELFKNNLDSLFYYITRLLESNSNEMIIELRRSKNRKSFEDFLQQFPEELKNNYFSFDIEELSEPNRVKVLVRKL